MLTFLFRKKILIPLGILLTLGIFVSIALFFTLAPKSSKELKEVYIREESNSETSARELKRNQIIRSEYTFKLLAKITNNSDQLKTGGYKLSASMPPLYILKKTTKGYTDYIKFTLPEGYSFYQLSEMLEKKGVYAESIMPYLTDQELILQAGAKYSIEGYLYPATYSIATNSSPKELLSNMISAFNKNNSELFKNYKGSLTKHEILTIASMIEKEAKTKDEMAMISSVFHNRLIKKMKLESDPTSVYGIRAFSGKITREDVRKETPYNTYVIKGLPPTPIGNPSIYSIRAAMYPTSTPYLYFVAKGDGTHLFSRTFEEHTKKIK